MVHLDAEEECDDRLALSRALADLFSATVDGLHFSQTIFDYNKVMQKHCHTNDDITPILKKAEKKLGLDVANEETKVRQKLYKSYDINAQPNWRRLQGYRPDDIVAASAQHDLFILSCNLNISRLLDDLDSTVVSIAADSDSLVCAVPSKLKGPISFVSALIAWNPSEGAANTVLDSMSVLKKAQTVTILVDPDNEGTELDALIRTLKKSDINAVVMRNHRPSNQYDLTLLEQAESGLHDYLVIAAFNHTSVKELLRSATMRRVLKNSTVPIFISR